MIRGNIVAYKDTSIRLLPDFSVKIMQTRRKYNDIYTTRRQKTASQKYAANFSFKYNYEINMF